MAEEEPPVDNVGTALAYHKLDIQNRKCKILKRQMFTKMKRAKSSVSLHYFTLSSNISSALSRLDLNKFYLFF